jgi:hypothetical protein
MEARKQATRLEQEKTLMALKNQFGVDAENRQRAADLTAGQDIASGGAALAAKSATQPGVAADGTLMVDGAGLDDPKVSRTDALRAKADYAEKRGYFKQAAEIRAQLDTERKIGADEARSKADNRRADTADKRADTEAEYKRGLLNRQEAREAERNKREKMVEVIDSDGSPRLVTREELNAAAPGKYRLVKSVAQESNSDAKAVSQYEAEIKRLRDNELVAPKSEKGKIQARIKALEAAKASLQGLELPTADNDPLGIRIAK